MTDYTNEAKNIVDGNRDRTLFLLWQILYGFELKMVRTCVIIKLLEILEYGIHTVQKNCSLSFQNIQIQNVFHYLYFSTIYCLLFSHIQMNGIISNSKV